MKLKDIFNRKNIASFIEGHITYFKQELVGLEPHIEEQVAYRLSMCENDCVPQEKCIVCECPTQKKVLVAKSCNNGTRFPDFMNKTDWENFKKQNNIES